MSRRILHAICVLFPFILDLVLCANGNSQLQSLYLLSYPDTDETQPSEGISLTLAAQLAVDHINNRSDILTDYRLELVSGKSGCSVLNHVSLFKNYLYNENNIAGIIGPGCSASTQSLGSIISRKALQTISVNIAGSLTLQNRETFPNSFSTIDSTRVFASALLKMMELRNWSEVFGIVDSSTDYYTTILKQIKSEKSPKEFTYLPFHTSTLAFNPVAPPTTVCTRAHRVIFFIASSKIVTRTLCLFFRQFAESILFPINQFVIVSHTMDDIVRDVTFVYDQRRYKCSAADIVHQLHGSIFLHYKLSPFNVREITSSGLTYNQFTNAYTQATDTYNKHVNLDDIKPSYWATSYFDAVWALSLALNNSIAELKGDHNLDISDYRLGHKNATDVIRKKLLQLSFSGLSGSINFNKSTGFVENIVDIYQVNGSMMTKLEYYNISDDSIVFYSNSSVQYIGHMFDTVTDEPIALGVVLILLLIVVLSVIGSLHAINIVYVSHPSIKATSPKVYHFAYIACYILVFATLLYTTANSFNIPPKQHCSLQHAAEFFFRIGDILLLATLTAIAFRIYRIFVHYMHPGRFVRDEYLIAFIILTTVIFTIIVGSTFVVFTPTESLECIKTLGRVKTVKVTCVYNELLWNLPTIVFPIILTVLASSFSILSSEKVTIKKFKTNAITLLCLVYYLNVGVWALFFLTNATGENPMFGPAVGSKITLLFCCIVLLFFPPCWPVFKDFYVDSRFQLCLSSCWHIAQCWVSGGKSPIRQKHSSSNCKYV